MTWINQLFTGKDNQTHDLGRWSWGLSIFTIIGLAVWQVAQAHQVSIMELAQSLGLVSGAHGATLWAKKDTEPTP